MAQDQNKARQEVNKVLAQQADKGIKRNEICRSLFSFGFSEHQVAILVGIKPQSAHAANNEHQGRQKGNEGTKEFPLFGCHSSSGISQASEDFGWSAFT
jgi:hypothetical protein